MLLVLSVDTRTLHAANPRRGNMSKIILVLVGSFLFLNFINPVSADEFDDEDEDMGNIVS